MRSPQMNITPQNAAIASPTQIVPRATTTPDRVFAAVGHGPGRSRRQDVAGPEDQGVGHHDDHQARAEQARGRPAHRPAEDPLEHDHVAGLGHQGSEDPAAEPPVGADGPCHLAEPDAKPAAGGEEPGDGHAARNRQGHVRRKGGKDSSRRQAGQTPQLQRGHGGVHRESPPRRRDGQTRSDGQIPAGDAARRRP